MAAKIQLLNNGLMIEWPMKLNDKKELK